MAKKVSTIIKHHDAHCILYDLTNDVIISEVWVVKSENIEKATKECKEHFSKKYNSDEIYFLKIDYINTYKEKWSMDLESFLKLASDVETMF